MKSFRIAMTVYTGHSETKRCYRTLNPYRRGWSAPQGCGGLHLRPGFAQPIRQASARLSHGTRTCATDAAVVASASCQARSSRVRAPRPERTGGLPQASRESTFSKGARYTAQDTGRRCISHRTRSRVLPTPARENILCDRERVPGCHRRPCSHLVVLSGVHRFATCVAAARSASEKGARYVPEGGSGVNPPFAVDNPLSLLHDSMSIGSVRFGNGRWHSVSSGQQCL